LGLFSRKTEERAEAVTPPIDGVLLESIMGRTIITKDEALNIPSVQSCIKFATDTVSMLPIKLYKESKGKVTEVLNDNRVKLLNDDTGDTLDAVQFIRALVTDYLLGKGGYAYICKYGNDVLSLHYVEESQISINTNADPIFKDYSILVQGRQYKPYDFIKLLRNTRDGAQGTSIIEENSLILSVAYQTLVFEETLVKKGGNKKGFLKSVKTLTQDVMDKLKLAWRNLYSNNSDNIVILNNGIEFQEASNSSVEMQLNENKVTNSEEICKLFNFPINVINGKATDKEYSNGFKLGIMPILKVIECALNRDLLLEKEKSGDEVFYYAFDTKEMLKGDIKTRYEAYAIGIKSGFMKIDEVRYEEDKEAFGIDWINLGLDSVLFDTKTKEIYTPNTNKKQDMEDLQQEELPTKGDKNIES